MSKINYYDNKNILSKNATYNILIGERSNGKSYCIKKKQCLEKSIKSGKVTFIIIKRLAEDIKKGYIEEYFADMPIRTMTKGKYNSVIGYRDNIYLANITDDGQTIRGQQIGKAMALSNDERYKSREYPDVTDIVFEEFVTAGLYLKNEVKRFMQLVSTILRRRKGQVWLIANTISRICPYFNEWGLRGIPTMKIGQIDTYTFHELARDGSTYDVVIAVEYCSNGGENVSGMFFGNYAKNIDGGAWESDDYPHLPCDYNELTILYMIGIKYSEFGYILSLCLYDSNLFLYVKPASKNGDNFRLPYRVLSNDFTINKFETNSLNMNNKAEKMISMLYRQGKICYSHNLCGADFTSCIKNMHLIL